MVFVIKVFKNWHYFEFLACILERNVIRNTFRCIIYSSFFLIIFFIKQMNFHPQLLEKYVFEECNI